MNRALNRGGYGGYSSGGRGRGKKKLDPSNPKDIAYLRAMHPDFDEVMISADVSYKTQCVTDAGFANKYKMPPVLAAARCFRDHTNSVDAVAWLPEQDHFISAAHDKTLKLWDSKSGRCIDTLEGHGAGIYHCSVARSGKLLVSCGSGSERDNNVLLWQWPQKKVVMQIKGHRRSVLHATFSSDSQSVATGDQDGNILVHDVASGKCRLNMNLHLGSIRESSFCTEDDNLILTVGDDGFLRLLDFREQVRHPAFNQLPSVAANVAALHTGLSIPRAHDGDIIYAVSFCCRETAFSGGGDHKLKRWDLRMLAPWSPKCAGEYLGHSAPVRSLSVSETGRFIVSGCEDGSCRIWPRDERADVQASIKGLRTEISELEAKDRSSQEATTRLLALRKSLAEAKVQDDHLKRDGYCSSVRCLTGHVSQVSGVAWREQNGCVSILSSSWDQSIKLYNLNLHELQ